MAVTCGIDWAEVHHDVALCDSTGATLAKKRIGTGMVGFTELMAMIAEYETDIGSVPVAIETDKNLIVVALQAAGFRVYPINPRAVARYRERYAQAGGKSDPGDAIVLANILRTDAHLHRPLPDTSELLQDFCSQWLFRDGLVVAFLRFPVRGQDADAVGAAPGDIASLVALHQAEIETVADCRVGWWPDRQEGGVRVARMECNPSQFGHSSGFGQEQRLPGNLFHGLQH